MKKNQGEPVNRIKGYWEPAKYKNRMEENQEDFNAVDDEDDVEEDEIQEDEIFEDEDEAG
jgi:hypothetical protein